MFLVAVAGGDPAVIAAEAAVSANAGDDVGPAVFPPPVWTPDGRAIVFPAATDGNVHVVSADAGTGNVRSIVTGSRQVTSIGVHWATGRIAFSAADLDTPADVYTCAGDGSAEERLTRVNAQLFAGAALPRVERRTFGSPHGGTVDGWLFYGAFMSSWIITHTDRFKAAAIDAPVANLESFHGTSDVGIWFAPFEMRGSLVATRESYRRLSPINYVDRVTTPTLILHGEADDRCPIGQGEELFAGLVAAGRVPVEFVRYPGGSHGFVLNGRPSHRVDFSRRVTDWVERYAGDPPR